MLERVAVHQTRLRTPGLGLDAKGVALGSKGLVLLPSLDRLVAFFALYTRGSSLGDLLRSLSVEVVRSKLGAREVTLSFGAESSDRLDKVAEIARLAGGYTFTGTSRHFVQYRDAGAPFGYDVAQINASDAALVLYHSAFGQTYEVERKVDLRALLLRLEPHADPASLLAEGPRWLVAEAGLGPALIQYFVRSAVDAEVGLAEWPPASGFEEGPVVRYLFRVEALPARMLPLLTKTPGLSTFLPVASGAAVEAGFRHPVNLRACPVFEEGSLVLFRGRREEPLCVERLPALGPVSAFARIEMLGSNKIEAAQKGGAPGGVAVALRLLPSTEPMRNVTATWVGPEELALLRQVAYALGPETLRKTKIAVTKRGAFVRSASGVEGIPVGSFYREVHTNLFLPAGFDALPAVAPDVLFRALGSPPGQALFVEPSGGIVGVPLDAFQSLETMLLEAQTWVPLDGASAEVSAALATELPEVVLEPLGMRPMRDVAEAEGAE
jgi:hypothetical protein